jgi:hypothetical protein
VQGTANKISTNSYLLKLGQEAKLDQLDL